MSIKGTRAFDLYDAVVTTLQGTSGFSGPTGDGIVVFDGPVVTDDEPRHYVTIGSTVLAGDDTEESAFTIQSQWQALPVSINGRQEAITLRCGITRWSGDGTWSNLRADVESTLDMIAAALINVQAVGLSGMVGIVLSNFDLIQFPNPNGNAVTLSFDIEASFLL